MKTFPTIQAVLFDMDGLMLDTERLNLRCWQQAMVDFGLEPDAAIFLSTVGLTDEKTDQAILAAVGDMGLVQAIRVREQQHMAEHIARHGVPLKPGLAELLDLLDALGLPRAVASSRNRASVTEWLTLAGIAPRLDVLVGGEDVVNGKPAPDIFLLAASRLAAGPARRNGIEPAGCLVLEDSEAGIRAAHAAGMIPVLVPDLLPPSQLARSLAHRIIASLHDVPALLADSSADRAPS